MLSPRKFAATVEPSEHWKGPMPTKPEKELEGFQMVFESILYAYATMKAPAGQLAVAFRLPVSVVENPGLPCVVMMPPGEVKSTRSSVEPPYALICAR